MPDPKYNHLLASLPNVDFLRIRPHLHLVGLQNGEILYNAGQLVSNIYFPTSALVSLATDMADGRSIDTALIGTDGMVTLAAFHQPKALSRAHVSRSGFAYQINRDILVEECRRGEAFYDLLMSANRFLINQMNWNIVCNRFHSVEQRIARWFLEHQDKSASSQITVTHTLLSASLGVRREAVTLANLKLNQMGAIHCTRGVTEILDRPLLESLACECYANLRQQHPFYPSLTHAETVHKLSAV